MNSTVRFNDVDIVVNRNTLQKLLNFTRFKRGSKAFYLELNMIHKTLCISRGEGASKAVRRLRAEL